MHLQRQGWRWASQNDALEARQPNVLRHDPFGCVRPGQLSVHGFLDRRFAETGKEGRRPFLGAAV